ncbi:MAG: hypothetical protein KAR38_05375, partial [Calditrichia bacterium]|nr:hypothetical protein [Calditrichia bacterium]
LRKEDNQKSNIITFHSGFMPSRKASLCENLSKFHEIPTFTGMTTMNIISYGIAHIFTKKKAPQEFPWSFFKENLF